MRRRLTFIVYTTVVLIVGLALLARWLEPRLAFYPVKGETETPAGYKIRFDARDVITPEGDRLRAWVMRAPNPRANVVYFHGNGGNLSAWAFILAGIVQRGYSVFAFDYRGYGLSTGWPTELGLYHDAGIVADKGWTDPDPGVPIIYWGRSLGGTMAAYAAIVRPPDGIILESSFPDARAVVRDSTALVILSLFATYRFPTAEFANRARRPVLVIHGTQDRVIPFALGQELFAKLAVPKQFVAIQGGDHDDAVPRNPTPYWSAIAGFVDSVRRK